MVHSGISPRRAHCSQARGGAGAANDPAAERLPKRALKGSSIVLVSELIIGSTV